MHEVIRPALHAPLTPIRTDNVRCGPGGNFIVPEMGTAFLGSTIQSSATGYKPSTASDEKVQSALGWQPTVHSFGDMHVRINNQNHLHVGKNCLIRRQST
jgi:hypothetical protein